ncbi:MAG: hypothetical protein V4495_02385 [Pseudomonadota bacterium]
MAAKVIAEGNIQAVQFLMKQRGVYFHRQGYGLKCLIGTNRTVRRNYSSMSFRALKMHIIFSF